MAADHAALQDNQGRSTFMSLIVSRRRRASTRKLNSGAQLLTREVIIAAALRLIDRDGLDAFSMRNLAKDLDVTPTAIYWYIDGRNALLADVVTQVLQDLAPTDDSLSWQDWFYALFAGFRERIRRHPNIAPLIGMELVSNASLDFGLIEGILATLTRAGFQDLRIVAAYNAVIATMMGFATHEFAMAPSDEADVWQDGMKNALAVVDELSHPLLARHMTAMRNRAFIVRWQNGVDVPLDEGFELYVNAMIAGLEHLVRADRGAGGS